MRRDTPLIPPELLIRRRLLFLRMLSHPLLMPGLNLRKFRFLIGRKNLICLRHDPRMFQLDLSVSLRLLRYDRLRLGLVEIPPGDQLHHLLMDLSFLLHQRMQSRLFVGNDLLDLRLLRVGEIQRFSEKTQRSKFAVVPWPSAFLRYGEARHHNHDQARN